MGFMFLVPLNGNGICPKGLAIFFIIMLILISLAIASVFVFLYAMPEGTVGNFQAHSVNCPECNSHYTEVKHWYLADANNLFKQAYYEDLFCNNCHLHWTQNMRTNEVVSKN